MKYPLNDAARFGWYEATLSFSERKQRGHFSTPPTLVEQILDACGYISTSDLSSLRLLDPACGSGNFLACAARRLAGSLQAQGLEDRKIGPVIGRNIWGLDPDPVACFLAEMQVRCALEESRVGESALARLPVHIHQADSLTLSWQPCVDLLVANPPYLAAKNTDLSIYRRAQQRGQADSYLLFFELALRAVRPGGWLGLVLPDPVLARSNALPERALLLHEYTLHHIWHLSGVFAAEVGAVVIIAQRVAPHPLHRIPWTRVRWQHDIPLCQPEQTIQRVGQALLARQPGTELRYLLCSGQGRTIERLRRAVENTQAQEPDTGSLMRLGQLVSIRRGEEIGRDSPLLGPRATLANSYPVLRGGIDLQPYTRPVTDWGMVRAAVKKPVERYLKPKLLVVKSTGRLLAALDTYGHVVLQTLYLLHLPEQSQDQMMDTYYFLLALLNSRLLRAYVYHLHTAYKMVQPQIEQGVLNRLPIPWGLPDQQRKISALARELEDVCGKAGSVVEWEEHHLASLYEEQERAICALYATVVPERYTDKEVVKNG